MSPTLMTSMYFPFLRTGISLDPYELQNIKDSSITLVDWKPYRSVLQWVN